MKRREFIACAGAAAGASFFWPATARAQQAERMRRIGILAAGANDSDGQARIAAFQQGLQALGWREGGNVVIDVQWGGGGDDGIRAAAAELVSLKPDVVLVNGDRGLRALAQTTRVIPIVFAGLNEPVDSGFVASLSRPGGNITGFASAEGTMIGKSLGLLNLLAPRAERVAVAAGFAASLSPERSRMIADAARSLGIGSELMLFDNAPDIERAFAAFAHRSGGGLALLGDANISAHRALIIELAARYQLPAIYPFKNMATSGGLMSYGADIIDQTRRAAAYVDRILKGEKPGELPVQMPTKFEFVINLKTAKALGLEIPPTLLAIADEVIE